MEKIWKPNQQTFHSVEDYILTVSGQTREQLLNPECVDPRKIQHLTEAAHVIESSILEGYPIVIVGDYDADGVTSTAILSMLFSIFGTRPKVIIPRRFTDGYGVSERLVAGIENSLIVCVDNGVVAFDAVRAAKKNGNRVVILDHHQPMDILPEADVIVDPHIEPEKSAFTDYCGAGLSLKLAEYMIPDVSVCRDLFSSMTVLACIGTIADVMPLIGDNRRIVKEGLQIINSKEGLDMLNPGIRELLIAGGIPCDEETIGFQIAPMINAVGRLYDAGSLSALKTILCRQKALAEEYVQKMKEINNKRQYAVRKWYQKYLPLANEGDRIQILYLPEAPEGIIGIIAGKLTEEIHTPVIVFTDASEKGIYKGSGRSYGGFDMSLLVEHIRPYTLACGGHAGAAGLSVRAEGFEELCTRAKAFMENFQLEEDWKYRIYDIELPEREAGLAWAQMREYAPFGQGVPRPVFAIRNFHLVNRYGNVYQQMGKDMSHIKLYGIDFDAVGFGMASRYEELGRPSVLHILGSLGENSYRGKTTIQFTIEAMNQDSDF